MTQNGTYHGLYTETNQQGRVLRQGHYHYGQPEGTWHTWDVNGRLVASLQYMSARGAAYLTEYSPKGHKVAAGPVVHNMRHGAWQYYYANGRVKAQGSFYRGQAHGQWVAFHKNGRKASKQKWAHGARDGQFVSYHKNGGLNQQGHYTSGSKEGTWAIHSPAGKLTSVQEYKTAGYFDAPELE